LCVDLPLLKAAPHYEKMLEVNAGLIKNYAEAYLVFGRNDAREYLSAINSVYVPKKVVRVLSISSDAQEIKELGYPSRVAVYLCVGKKCSMPISKHENLTLRLKNFMDTLRH
jgi:uncharacterized protein YyaL (SSP411 family)